MIIEEKVNGIGPWHWPDGDYDLICWKELVADWKSHEQKWFKNVKKFNVCVQAGGFTGLYPRLLSERFKQVITFEPMPQNFHFLKLNCPQDNIVKIHKGLSTDDCMLRMYIDGNNKNGPYIDTPGTKVDNLDLEELDLLALDVEHYEPWVLMGAVITIMKFRPVVVCENGNNLINIFEALNYEIQEISCLDTIFIPKIERNFINVKNTTSSI